ncbi:cytochrome c oxidase assembly factor CtaG [Metabacillus arenae]|uniref:Cytochrome c oxidase assembly factor CtaG n=1 Tax=Metabacillus arenae TaxID=2771434 RepID=A0A926NCF9_9BACI|nr:cytochrome c oxidase assembly factor CtaG [Metabacillus arenae]MBD1380954.1 cytochrome c oxidase assembly factor CtaG [Metabacillus arenae]
MENLDIFGFRALWSPYYALALILITVFYFLVIGRWRNRFQESGKVSTKQKSIFVSAVLLLYVTKGSPLDLLGHIIFSAHMTQMALLYLVVPILLIKGIPDWLWKAILSLPVVKHVFSFLTKPIIALIVFNGIFSFYHIPLIFDFVKTDAVYHSIITTAIFVASFAMWWPLLNTLPGWIQLNGIKKLGYIFADGVLLTPACALIIFADTPLYATYSDPQMWVNAMQLCVPGDMMANLSLTGPEMFNTLPLVDDQQLGGVLMKIIQEIVYGTVLGMLFFQWVRSEKEKEELEAAGGYNPEPVK